MNRLNFPAGALLLVALLLNGCGHKPADVADALPAVSVQTQVAESKNRVATEENIGTVRAKLHAVIEAKVSGKIEQMLVVPGQPVTNGELLGAIDAREIQAQYDQALAVRQQAESDLKRATDLFQQKILSSSEFDAAQSKFRVADAAATEAKTLLGYTRVTAPFDGVITRKDADVGDLAAPGKSLLEMEDPRISVSKPTCRKQSSAESTRRRTGRARGRRRKQTDRRRQRDRAVRRSRTAARFSSNWTCPDARSARRPVRPGAVPVGEISALRVPASAVVQRGEMELVFVVANGHAQLRMVKTGKHIGDEVELVSGVDAGEQVVTDGASNLMDGQPVELQP